MTNEEAINYGEDYLKDSICAVCGVEDKHKEFVKMSISALEKQIKLNKLGFTEEVIENYKIFEDECIEKGFTFRSLLDARERQINGDWIPCSEKLPPIPKENTLFENKPLELYLVSDGYSEYATKAFWNGKDFTDGWGKLKAVAWQPLPQPYSESEDK